MGAHGELAGEGKEGEGGEGQGARLGGTARRDALGGRAAGGLDLCSFMCAVRGCFLYVREGSKEEGERRGKRKRKEKKWTKGKKYGKFSKLENFQKIKDNLWSWLKNYFCTKKLYV
jgi:hypothetical protein